MISIAWQLVTTLVPSVEVAMSMSSARKYRFVAVVSSPGGRGYRHITAARSGSVVGIEASIVGRRVVIDNRSPICCGPVFIAVVVDGDPTIKVGHPMLGVRYSNEGVICRLTHLDPFERQTELQGVEVNVAV